MTTLLESGAKVDDRDEHGTTALMWAAKTNSNPEITTTLLENGAKDKDGQTLLAAVRNPNPQIVTTLLDVLVHTSNRSGWLRRCMETASRFFIFTIAKRRGNTGHPARSPTRPERWHSLSRLCPKSASGPANEHPNIETGGDSKWAITLTNNTRN